MSAIVNPSQSLKDLDGPKGIPFFGNLFQIDLDQFHRDLERWSDEFGPIFKIRMGPVDIVIVADSTEINQILKHRPDVYRRQASIEKVIEELGFNGVFSSEGESWRRQRKIVAMALNSAHIKGFFPQMHATTERLLKRWQNLLGESLDFPREVMRYTVDITTELAFGVNVNTLETDGPVIQRHLDKVFPCLANRINALVPYWRYVRLPRDREVDEAVQGIESTVNGFIRDCREKMARQPELFEEPTNFLEAVIAAQTTEVGTKFTDQEIYSNVVTLLIAGEDTTANTISWAIKYFIEFPEVFQRARAEVDSVLGDDLIVSHIDQLAKFPYLEACANETMRLKPVGPIFPMETNEPTELLGYHIPQGTRVLALTRQIATQAENFGDPERFDPSRWLQDEARAGCPHDTRAFMPFGTGPRFCPGRNLALVEIKIALALVCRNFDLELAEPTRGVEERLSFAMVPKNLDVRLRAREEMTTNEA